MFQNQERLEAHLSHLEIEEQGGEILYEFIIICCFPPQRFRLQKKSIFVSKNIVQIWDVSVQREIEITREKDSYKLVQLMTCRDLSKSKVGKCYYTSCEMLYGKIINDPLIYKVEDDKWRVYVLQTQMCCYTQRE